MPCQDGKSNERKARLRGNVKVKDGVSSHIPFHDNSKMKENDGSTTWFAVALRALKTRDERKVSEDCKR